MRVLLLRSRSLVWREVSADWLLAGDLTAGKLVEQAAPAPAAQAAQHYLATGLTGGSLTYLPHKLRSKGERKEEAERF